MKHYLHIFYAFMYKVNKPWDAYLPTVFGLSFLIQQCFWILVFALDIENRLPSIGYMIIPVVAIICAFILFKYIGLSQREVHVNAMRLLEDEFLKTVHLWIIGGGYLGSFVVTVLIIDILE